MTETLNATLTRLREEMDGPPFHHFLQPQPISADPQTGTVTIRLPFRPEFARAKEQDAFHGGIIAALIDLAGHAAVAVKIGRMAPTIDLRIDYLRPATAEALIACARLIKAGRSVARVDIEVCDTKRRVVALGRGTFSTS